MKITAHYFIKGWKSGLPVTTGATRTAVVRGIKATSGKALPLTQAKLKISDKEYVKDIGEGDLYAVFEVVLEQGPAHLQTWLTDGKDITVGAYYVYVRCTE